MDKDEIAFLRKVIKAQDKLLICYRLGGRPPEWVFDILAKFRDLYDNSKATSEPTTPPDQATTDSSKQTQGYIQAIKKAGEERRNAPGR